MLQIHDFVKLQKIIFGACPFDPVLSLVLWIALSTLDDILNFDPKHGLGMNE